MLRSATVSLFNSPKKRERRVWEWCRRMFGLRAWEASMFKRSSNTLLKSITKCVACPKWHFFFVRNWQRRAWAKLCVRFWRPFHAVVSSFVLERFHHTNILWLQNIGVAPWSSFHVYFNWLHCFQKEFFVVTAKIVQKNTRFMMITNVGLPHPLGPYFTFLRSIQPLIWPQPETLLGRVLRKFLSIFLFGWPLKNN